MSYLCGGRYAADKARQSQLVKGGKVMKALLKITLVIVIVGIVYMLAQQTLKLNINFDDLEI